MRKSSSAFEQHEHNAPNNTVSQCILAERLQRRSSEKYPNVSRGRREPRDGPWAFRIPATYIRAPFGATWPNLIIPLSAIKFTSVS
jgi:hypothetical protein